MTAPSEEQLARIEEFVRRKSGAEKVDFQKKEDPSLGGGFVLAIDGKESDWSNKGRVEQEKERIEQAQAPQGQSCLLYTSRCV